jgi:hypothetical protein
MELVIPDFPHGGLAMQKLIVLSAALVLGGWLVSGSAAKADMGCLCTSLGKAACVSGIGTCLSGAGVCLLPCDYTPVKAKKSSKKMSKKPS